MKSIWDLLGDIRTAFTLLIAASAILLTGSFYAEHHWALFKELNRTPVQQWLTMHFADQRAQIWWVPTLFVIMTALGLNTLICAGNRVLRLLRQRRSTAPARFFYLLAPSLIHFLFIVIMIGHLITFTTGRWLSVPLKSGAPATTDSGKQYQVKAIVDRYYPETSALRDRISQTIVILEDADRNAFHLQYLKPAFTGGRFMLLDKIENSRATDGGQTAAPTSEDTCNQAQVYKVTNKTEKQGRQRLLIVSDPGLFPIVAGLTLILAVMAAYFYVQTKANHVSKKTEEKCSNGFSC